MLSCEDVRALLGEIETGDPASGAVRDHLASCRGCRADAERVRAELRDMRADLAALAPSPFLEDAVLQTARETGMGPAPRRAPGRRAAIAVSLAAAAILLVVLLAKPRGAGDPAPEPTHDRGEHDRGGQEARDVDWAGSWAPALLRTPPSPLQVAASRTKNPWRLQALKTTSPGLYVTVFPGTESYTATIPELPRAQPHRWVVPASEAGGADRTYELEGFVDEDLCVIGGSLLRHMPEGYRGAAGAPDRVAVVIADPSGSGASVRVEALYRHGYTGDLLVPAALGRALGLHGFELPGSVRIRGDELLRAHRALARVTVPDWEVDAVQEVQVRAPILDRGPAPRAVPGRSQSWGLHLAGELPQGGYANSQLMYDTQTQELGVAGTRFEVDPRSQRWPFFSLEAPLRGLTLVYEPDAHPRCLVCLPAVDAGAGNQTLILERVTLEQRFEAGWEVAIARVWRERTMIPAADSVALTEVGTDGRVSFVHCRGERGPLRMRLYKAGEEPRFVTIRLEEPERPRMRIEIDASGTLHFAGRTVALAPRDPETGVPGLDLHSVPSVVEAFGATGGPPGSVSPVRIDVTAPAETPWAALQGLLLAGAQTGHAHYRFALQDLDEGSVRYRLPIDRGIYADDPLLGSEEEEEEEGGPPRPPVRRNRHVQEIRISHEDGRSVMRLGPMESRGMREELRGDLAAGSGLWKVLREEMLRRRDRLPPKQRLRVLLAFVPKDLGRVPYQDVLRLLRALAGAAVEDVYFGNAKPSKRK